MVTNARQDFWSRRRQAVQAEAEAQQAAQAAEIVGTPALEDERPDHEVLAELGLSDPEKMQPGDDFTSFLRKEVPEHLRRRALRRLWRTNPVLANVDGLVDYGSDFTDAATVIPNMQTAYQVGRGMTKHVMALAEAAEASNATEIEPEGEADNPDPDVTLASVAPDDTALAVEEAAETGVPDPVVSPDDQPDQAVPPQRHMRFAFTG